MTTTLVQTRIVEKIHEFSLPTPAQFRQEAIEAIGSAIAQRNALIKNKTSYIKQTPEHFQVQTQYCLYKGSWTIRGISRFLIKYREELIQLIPWTNKPALNRMRQLCELAKQFQNFA